MLLFLCCAVGLTCLHSHVKTGNGIGLNLRCIYPLGLVCDMCAYSMITIGLLETEPYFLASIRGLNRQYVLFCFHCFLLRCATGSLFLHFPIEQDESVVIEGLHGDRQKLLVLLFIVAPPVL